MWPSGEPDRRSSPSANRAPIDESMAVTRHVGSKNTDLTVRNFARRISILPRYSARCLALLEKAGLIDHQHRVLVGKMLRAWLLSIVRNTAYSWIRKNRLARPDCR